MLLVETILVFIFTILPFAVGLPHGSHMQRDHHEIAIAKRGFDGARFTWYDVGLGACGIWSAPSDFIVALNSDQFGSGFPSKMCHKPITITCGGKTAQATVVDECMGCPYGGLDFSRGLFDFFATESVGVLSGFWSFD